MQCLKCQQETSNPKFCSRSCGIAHNNAANPKRQKTRKPCKICNKQTNYSKANFCSHECYSQDRWNTIRERIQQTGIIHPTTNFHSSPTAKKFITEALGYHCSICHLSTWQNQPLVLVLDHINGRPNDWRIENLRLVCPNCDSQLPTFKSKNKNGGRPSRRVTT